MGESGYVIAARMRSGPVMKALKTRRGSHKGTKESAGTRRKGWLGELGPFVSAW